MKIQLIAGILLSAALGGTQNNIPVPHLNLASNAAVTFTTTATNDLTSLLQRGLFEEEGNRDYHAAIASYQSLIAQFDQNRQIAATAIFRLGECHRKLVRTNEAVAQYERMVHEFSDQQTLVTLSRKNLTELGFHSTDTAAAVLDDEDKEIHRIQTMIQDSPDLINLAASGSTPLIQAASADQIRVVTFLLDHGADINLKAASRAPLHAATESGNKAMVELLLNRGADVNATDGTGGTALHIAAEKGFRSVAEVLLAHHADINAPNSEMNDAQTALPRAAALGNVEMMKLLIAHAADVNVRSKQGSTPLKVALGPRNRESVKTLLAAKANPDLADNQGVTPLSDAAGQNNVEFVHLLLDAKADPNGGTLNAPILLAIAQSNTNLLELLLRAGADPNRPGGIDRQLGGPNFVPIFTNSPLAFACAKHQPSTVRLLLEFKADPKGSDAGGQPLVFNGLLDPEILKLLLEAGADANAVETSSSGIAAPGETPLLVAATSRFTKSPDGNSYSISQSGDAAAARLLLEHGANVNARRPSDDATPLHLAALTDNRELVERLLASKADVNARDNTGKTPLDWAKESMPPAPTNPARLAVVDLLRQHGALDDLPKPDRIQVRRANYSAPVFTKAPTAGTISACWT